MRHRRRAVHRRGSLPQRDLAGIERALATNGTRVNAQVPARAARRSVQRAALSNVASGELPIAVIAPSPVIATRRIAHSGGAAPGLVPAGQRAFTTATTILHRCRREGRFSSRSSPRRRPRARTRTPAPRANPRQVPSAPLSGVTLSASISNSDHQCLHRSNVSFILPVSSGGYVPSKSAPSRHVLQRLSSRAGPRRG